MRIKPRGAGDDSPPPFFLAGGRMWMALAVSLIAHLVVLRLAVVENSPLEMPDAKQWIYDISLAISDGTETEKPPLPTRSAAGGKPSAGFHAEVSVPAAATENLHEVNKAEVVQETGIRPVSSVVDPAPTMVDSSAAANMGETMARRAAEQEAGAREGFMSRVNQQFILIKLRHFLKTTRLQLRTSLAAQFSPEEMERFRGSLCTVMLKYDSNGSLKDVVIDSADASLGDAVAWRVDWKSIPTPAQFVLPYATMEVLLQFEESGISVGLKPA